MKRRDILSVVTPAYIAGAPLKYIRKILYYHGFKGEVAAIGGRLSQYILEGISDPLQKAERKLNMITWDESKFPISSFVFDGDNDQPHTKTRRQRAGATDGKISLISSLLTTGADMITIIEKSGLDPDVVRGVVATLHFIRGGQDG